MRRAILCLALLLAIVPLSAGSQEDPADSGIYIALGDSVAAGIGSSLPRQRSYPSLVRDYMEAHLGGTVVLENIAQPGESARSILTDGQFDQYVELLEEASIADLEVLAVTLTVGGNEVLEQSGTTNAERESALAEFSAAFDELAGMIAGRAGESVPVTVTTIYDPTATPVDIPFSDGWWIEQFNMVIREAASSHGLIVADVARALGSRAATLTRYPTDVHPTNAGHQAISRIVWNALGFDLDAPVINVSSAAVSNRLTPTLRFTVSEPVVEDEVTVTAEGDTMVYPVVQVDDLEYIALVDIANPTAERVSLSIEAVDLAGNRATVEHTLTLDLGPRP